MQFFLLISLIRCAEPTESNDNERPTAIESATHAIPPSAPTLPNEGEETSALTEPSSILPIIVPSFDESSARVIHTNESSSTVINESEPSSQETSEPPAAATATNQSEFVNPRGIRFTTAPTHSNTTTGPVKGLTSFIGRNRTPFV